MGSGVHSNKRMILGELIKKMGPIIRKPEIVTESHVQCICMLNMQINVVRKKR